MAFVVYILSSSLAAKVYFILTILSVPTTTKTTHNARKSPCSYGKFVSSASLFARKVLLPSAIITSLMRLISKRLFIPKDDDDDDDDAPRGKNAFECFSFSSRRLRYDVICYTREM